MVAQKDVAVARRRHAAQLVEVAVARAEPAPLAHVRAGCSVEHLDTVLPLIYTPGIADAKI